MKLKRPLFLSVLLIIIFQCAREFAVQLISPHIPQTLFAVQMLTMSIMAILAVGVFAYAKIGRVKFPFFPEKFSLPYVICTVVAAVLYIAAPSNFSVGLSSVMLILYGSIITPVYEETLFRGVIWEYYEREEKNPYIVYIWNAVLFSVWHLGYVIPNILDGDWVVVMCKLGAGLGYGLILGFIRMKTKNVYATVLAHGVINLLMM